MPYSVPNQKVITVRRERVTSDFLGIKNENWMCAARDLGAHSLMLYLYIASNADGYRLALSPAAVRQAIGMARSTYHDQFAKLIDKGYLVQTSGNGYDFFEIPQPRRVILQNSVSSAELILDESTSGDNAIISPVHIITGEDTEINNKYIPTDKTETNNGDLRGSGEIKIPEVMEIRIPVPKAEPKKPLLPKPKEKEFIF